MNRWLISLVLAAGILYAPCLKAGFVYDDEWSIVRNASLRDFQPLRYFTDPSTAADPASGLQGDVYRPLLTTFFAAQVHFWGLRPGPFHAVNLMLHLINGLLVAILLQRLLKNPWGVLIGAGIFLLHPVQVQTAAWISQQSNTLSAFFILCACLCFVPAARSTTRRTILGSACFAAAVFTKEHALVFPLLLGVLYLWDEKHVAIKTAWPLGVIAAAYALARTLLLPHWAQIDGGNRNLYDDFSLGVLSFPVYIAKLLLPLALRPSYRYPEGDPWIVLGSFLIVCAFLWGMARGRKRFPSLSVSMAWIFIGLLPALQIIPIRAFVAERFLYYSVMGLALGVGAGIFQVKRWRWPLGVWLVFLVCQSARAVPHWKNEYALWRHAVAVEPSNPFAQACLANVESRPDKAIFHYKQALLHHPAEDVAFTAKNNLAWLYLRKQEIAPALHWGQAALQMRPRNAATLYNLCLIHLARHDRRKARVFYRQIAQQVPPQSPLLADLSRRFK